MAFTSKVDSKGRVSIPVKVRENLGSSLIVTHSPDSDYLVIYTEAGYETLKLAILELPGSDPFIRQARRDIIGSSIICDVDNQGRIMITADLWSDINVPKGAEVRFFDNGGNVEICLNSAYTPNTCKEKTEYQEGLEKYAIPF